MNLIPKRTKQQSCSNHQTKKQRLTNNETKLLPFDLSKFEISTNNRDVIQLANAISIYTIENKTCLDSSVCQFLAIKICYENNTTNPKYFPSNYIYYFLKKFSTLNNHLYKEMFEIMDVPVVIAENGNVTESRKLARNIFKQQFNNYKWSKLNPSKRKIAIHIIRNDDQTDVSLECTHSTLFAELSRLMEKQTGEKGVFSYNLIHDFDPDTDSIDAFKPLFYFDKIITDDHPLYFFQID